MHTQDLLSEQDDRRFVSAVLRAVSSTPHDSDGCADQVPQPGSLLAGRFVIEHELGRGGMGAVFAARDQRMNGRAVAIKCLFSRADSARDATGRMLREASAAFDHPNVVRIYDVDVERQFLVMERLVGMSLAQRLGQGPFAIDEACALMEQTLEGLAAVHAQGLVHRDLKPENIFLADDGQGSVVAKILDFGIVKPSAHTHGHWTATQEGVVLGTPAYMAPEQWTGRPVDARADLYALSAVLYELLTMRHPLRSASGQLARGLAGHLLVPPSRFRPELPPALDRLIMKGLSVLPDERHQSATALRDALRAATCSDGVVPRRRGWLPVVLGAVVLIGLTGGGLTLGGGEQPVHALPPPLPRPMLVAPAVAQAAALEPTVVQPTVDTRTETQDTTLLDLLGLDEVEAKRILRQAGPTTSAQLAHAVEQLRQLDAPSETESADTASSDSAR